MTDSPPSPRRLSSFRKSVLAVALLFGIPVATLAYWLVLDGSGRFGLWHVVDKLCVPAQRWLGTPFPCLEVSFSGKYAILRAPFDGNQFLVVPLAPILGIEDPAMRIEDAPDLWSVAWRERRRVAEGLGRGVGDDRIALAVNSESSRTQSHYHIHVDCVAGTVRRFLADSAGTIGDDWREVRPAPWAAPYFLRRIDLAMLARERPERLIDRELKPSAEDIANLSIAVLGLSAGPGETAPRLMLAATYGYGEVEGGHAEELMDHACAAD